MTVITNSSGHVYLGSNGNALVNENGSLLPSGSYPLVDTLTSWNVEKRDERLTPNFTLPNPLLNSTEEIRYIFIADTANASFTAPANFMISDDDYSGLSAGNTLAYTALIVGCIYEVSFCVINSTHIGVILKKWKT